MANKTNDKDKDGQRAKEIILEVLRDFAAPIAVLICAIVGLVLIGFLLNGSISVFQKDVGWVNLPTAEFQDPRIISIRGASGELVRNPLATYDTTNSACSDLSARYWQSRNLFCSASMKAQAVEARASHEWFLGHYKAEYYNFTTEFQGLNATATLWKAQAWERKWIAYYDKLLEGCAILEMEV